MSQIEKSLLSVFGDTGTRIIRLSKSEYDQTQHELCMSMAQMLWGESGLVESLGPTWNLVFDPRFSECERVWVKTQKVTGTQRTTTMGIMEINDKGDVSTSRMISLEQYSEIIGEARHYAKVLEESRWQMKVAGLDLPQKTFLSNPREAKGWDEQWLTELIKQESPNYFTREGKPNELATTWVEMLKKDVLGLILDYSELPSMDLWVTVEGGDVVLDPTQVDAETPIAQAEIEYLDRALTYRAILRANTVKVLGKLGGKRLAQRLNSVKITEYDKDRILREVFTHPYDQIYKALPAIDTILKYAEGIPIENREDLMLQERKKESARVIEALRSGALKPMTVEDAYTNAEEASEEAGRFEKIHHSKNLVTLFYVLVQAEEMVKGYPGFQAVIDLVLPVIESAVDPGDEAFAKLCVEVQDLADKAIVDQAVCEEEKV